MNDELLDLLTPVVGESDEGKTVKELAIAKFGSAKHKHIMEIREILRVRIAEGVVAPGRGLRPTLAGHLHGEPVFRRVVK